MIIWLTGNSGAGKTTLAEALCESIDGCIMLDGDEMRQSISLGAGFTATDRDAHNRRVARLANVLHKQPNVEYVVISVIAPYQSTRSNIDKIVPGVVWIYLKRVLPERENYPYEPPENAYTIDVDDHSVRECVGIVEEIITQENT